MDRQEILVHITAPCMRADDEKMRSLAEQLENFEVAAWTVVWGPDDHEAQLNRSFTSTNSDFFEASIQTTRAIQEIQIEQDQPEETQYHQATIPPYVSSVSSADPLLTGRGHHYRRYTSLHLPNSNRNPNPPYRNPFHKREISRNAVQVAQTQSELRPSTAPVGSSATIQVPMTDGVMRKRARSEESSFGSFLSHISDSQPPAKDSEDVQTPASGLVGGSIIEQSTHMKAQNHDKHVRKPASKRRRITVSEVPDLSDMLMAEAARASSNREGSPEQAAKVSYFLRNHSPGWTPSPLPSVPAPSLVSPSSTLSPSQPLALHLSQARISSSPLALPSPVDLTSESSPAVNRHREKTQAVQNSPGAISEQRLLKDPFICLGSRTDKVQSQLFDHLPSSSPPPPQTNYGSRPSSSIAHPSTQYGEWPSSSIALLPTQINPPKTPVNLGIFVTHITQTLAEIASELPLEKWFRPVLVTRDVHVLERGHWTLRVRIASERIVMAARKTPTKEELMAAREKQMAGLNASERMQKFKQLQTEGDNTAENRTDVWTEDEFLQLWERLSDFVKAGKAGWGIFVARDVSEEAITSGQSTHTNHMRLRIFTWGEVAGHMWLALWILSDKKSAYVPMEWVIGDDIIVLRMSGSRNRGGKLGPWVHKGPAGQHGRWGVGDLPEAPKD